LGEEADRIQRLCLIKLAVELALGVFELGVDFFGGLPVVEGFLSAALVEVDVGLDIEGLGVDGDLGWVGVAGWVRWGDEVEAFFDGGLGLGPLIKFLVGEGEMLRVAAWLSRSLLFL
jgi:hypothetical protein